MTLNWRVQEAPTGKYRSFDSELLAHARYPFR